jgi:transcriptional antiterminator RfaH
MPILTKETDIYPDNLFELSGTDEGSDVEWWAFYTRSRREKQLMRLLLEMKTPFYSPIISRRFRSPGGRIRESHIPLFSNYVFVFGDETQRYDALTTNCVSQHYPVRDAQRLVDELSQIQQLIELGRPLTPESRLINGDRVRVLNGALTGFEGVVLRRENESRLLVSVDFMQQGASVRLEDCELERLD